LIFFNELIEGRYVENDVILITGGPEAGKNIGDIFRVGGSRMRAIEILKMRGVKHDDTWDRYGT
jgi:KaiC/GvpD/RAD55 family RecA-like ATPase